jgi:hypothetical protein
MNDNNKVCPARLVAAMRIQYSKGIDLRDIPMNCIGQKCAVYDCERDVCGLANPGTVKAINVI